MSSTKGDVIVTSHGYIQQKYLWLWGDFRQPTVLGACTQATEGWDRQSVNRVCGLTVQITLVTCLCALWFGPRSEHQFPPREGCRKSMLGVGVRTSPTLSMCLCALTVSSLAVIFSSSHLNGCVRELKQLTSPGGSHSDRLMSFSQSAHS